MLQAHPSAPPSIASLHADVLGVQFASLPPALRAFHSLQGRHQLHGEVTIRAPANLLGRWIAGWLNMPCIAGCGPMRFEITANRGHEIWTRHFPGGVMRSTLDNVKGELRESIGPLSARFRLEAKDGTLAMHLLRISLWGVPLPTVFHPRVMTRESASPDTIHFDVKVDAPFIGRVVDYVGSLRLPVPAP